MSGASQSGWPQASPRQSDDKIASDSSPDAARVRFSKQSNEMARPLSDPLELSWPATRPASLPDARTPLHGSASRRGALAMHGAARDQAIVAAVAAIAYLAIAIFWLERGMNVITGDEPHYLVVAHALVYNHSLDLRPVYGRGPWAGLG